MYLCCIDELISSKFHCKFILWKKRETEQKVEYFLEYSITSAVVEVEPNYLELWNAAVPVKIKQLFNVYFMKLKLGFLYFKC